MIEIVSATRFSEQDFWAKSPLGISLRRLEHDKRLIPQITFANSRGLPEIYNSRITSTGSSDTLLFMHDDVWIDDYFLGDRVAEGLRTYDVVGVAGNRRRVRYQPSWAYVSALHSWEMDDVANLSGSVAHGTSPFGHITHFGSVPAECELLDGVFLAARKEILIKGSVLFDPQFEFHFYDMDFCRLARLRNLRLGTWPICVTHQSVGTLGVGSWKDKYLAYLKKWGG